MKNDNHPIVQFQLVPSMYWMHYQSQTRYKINTGTGSPTPTLFRLTSAFPSRLRFGVAFPPSCKLHTVDTAVLLRRLFISRTTGLSFVRVLVTPISSSTMRLQKVTSNLYTIEFSFTVALMIYDYSWLRLHGSSFSERFFAFPIRLTSRDTFSTICYVLCITPGAHSIRAMLIWSDRSEERGRKIQNTNAKSKCFGHRPALTSQPCNTICY